MPIDAYLAYASAPCRAVRNTASVLGIDIVYRNVDLYGGAHLAPEFLEHTVPTIDDDGFYLWESRAIQTYLANKYAPDSSLYPKDPKARAIVDRMLYFDAGTLFKAEAEYLYPVLFYGKAADDDKRVSFEKYLAVLEDILDKSPFVAGVHLTLADLSIHSGLTFAMLLDFDYSPFPKTLAWLERVKLEIPSYRELNEEPLQRFKEVLKTRK